MKKPNTQTPSPAYCRIDRLTLRYAVTLLNAYRQELLDQLPCSPSWNQDTLANRANDIKQTAAYLEGELSR
jgi:hypothetical protein